VGLYKRKGSPFYWMTARVNGRKVYQSTGTRNRKLAERICGKWTDDIVRDKWFPGEAPCDVTMDQLFDRYLADVSPHLSPTTHARNQQMVKKFRGFFGEVLVGEVTTAKVSGYKAKLLGSNSPGTARRELGLLRRIFHLAVDEWGYARENPVPKVMGTLKNADKCRVRYVLPEEEARLLEALPPWLAPIVELARNTGLRRANLLGIRWEDVDLHNRRLFIPMTKNGSPLGLPLNENASRVLTERWNCRRPGNALVFCEEDGTPLSGGKVGITFRRACKAAGIANLRFHDLRHDCASAMVQEGTTLLEVKELLGHKDLRMTQRYAHLAPDNLVKAVSVLDERARRRASGYTAVTLVKEKGQPLG
jgi:integrase